MIEWSGTELLVRDSVREFVNEQIRPRIDELERGELPPYEIIRKLFSTFGLDAMARDSFGKAIESYPDGAQPLGGRSRCGGGLFDQEAMAMLAFSEISKVSMGMTAAIGVSIGLTAQTIMCRGTVEQRRRWALDLLTFEKIGAWALTEPDAGSDAFGGMSTSARPVDGGYVLNGRKTLITNGPYADTVVVYAKLDDGSVANPRDRPVLTFVLDADMPGFTRSAPMRMMGMHSSPTGELRFTDVYLEADRLLAGPPGSDGRDSARVSYTFERVAVAAMALGIIEECLRLSLEHAKARELWGQKISALQLVQLKLATMEVARLNVRNLLFRAIELKRAGQRVSLAEASAIKLYSSQAATEVANEAVQLFGGHGYLVEYRVEQLARDARSLMIYAGSNELQVGQIARGLLR
ncbi:acyl-CoA dehydrogenase family protein [Pseudonocardia acaciae]|uniref:acyl-CoA dehydrogenase family protein n=1 Tax=Pseudonocardia acaciae TaxID=551276 RepID=UPI000490E9C4|nr:acyl-CoA dehydrogenase family protein [Pseudonocardia acaciae]